LDWKIPSSQLNDFRIKMFFLLHYLFIFSSISFFWICHIFSPRVYPWGPTLLKRCYVPIVTRWRAKIYEYEYEWYEHDKGKSQWWSSQSRKVFLYLYLVLNQYWTVYWKETGALFTKGRKRNGSRKYLTSYKRVKLKWREK